MHGQANVKFAWRTLSIPSGVLILVFVLLLVFKNMARNVAHFRYCVHKEEKGAFCGNHICHHDVFLVTESFVGGVMKFGANVVHQTRVT